MALFLVEAFNNQGGKMLIKISTLGEMKEKGWTLEQQIMYEAKELADQYVAEALKDLQFAKSLVKTQAARDAFDMTIVYNAIVGKARKQAFDETAFKYRRIPNENLGTLSEQETGSD
jgi:hypothetical protein